MSAQETGFGTDTKIVINGIAFAAVGGEVRNPGDVTDRTDTESLKKVHKRSPVDSLEGTIRAERAEDVSYHIAPLILQDGDGIALQIWPHGFSHADGCYDIPVAIVRNFSSNFNTKGGVAEEVSFDWVSSGDFFLPGE
jgi:hypothetical protein